MPGTVARHGAPLGLGLPSGAARAQNTRRLFGRWRLHGDRCGASFALWPSSLLPAAALAGELQDDLKARRARVMEALGPETVLVHWSAPTRVFSRDVDYEYRQDSDMLYLTGIDQDGHDARADARQQDEEEILFVSDADPRREHWQGHMLTKEEAQAASGVDEVRFASELEPFLGRDVRPRRRSASG